MMILAVLLVFLALFGTLSRAPSAVFNGRSEKGNSAAEERSDRLACRRILLRNCGIFLYIEKPSASDVDFCMYRYEDESLCRKTGHNTLTYKRIARENNKIKVSFS